MQADYLGYQFWSEPFVWVDTYVTIDHGLAIVHATKKGADVIDAPVYLFKASGSYLGKYERTHAVGQPEFLLPDQQYKFRVDYKGTQYWSNEVAIIPHEENNIEPNLDLLALDLTNNPNPVRFDGVPPEFKPEKVMVASLGSLTGLLTQAVISQIPGETVYYYINDHLDTPQKIVDENGVVVWAADYKPFGEADVTVTTVQNNFRFPGQYLDQKTGLHYNWHRYYDPQTGRYLAPDPLSLAQVRVIRQKAVNDLGRFYAAPSNIDETRRFLGSIMLYEYALVNAQVFNPYLYVQNGPIIYVDPLGLYSFREGLQDTVTYAWISAGAAAFSPGGQAAALPFVTIGFVATTLEVGLYSTDPFWEGVRESIKMLIPIKNPFLDKVKDEAIDKAYETIRDVHDNRTRNDCGR